MPASVDHNFVTVPISFLAAVQIGLFRKIGDLAYLPVATTGNLMRFLESAYDSVVHVDRGLRRWRARRRVRHRAWGTHAIWLPAALLAITLSLFLVDHRQWMR